MNDVPDLRRWGRRSDRVWFWLMFWIPAVAGVGYVVAREWAIWSR